MKKNVKLFFCEQLEKNVYFHTAQVIIIFPWQDCVATAAFELRPSEVRLEDHLMWRALLQEYRWDSSYSLNPAWGMFYLVNLANPGRLGNVLSTQQAQCPKWLQCLYCPPFTCQIFSIWVIGNVSPDSSHRKVDSLDHDGNIKRLVLIYLEALIRILTGAGEMARWLSALTALPGDPGSKHSTYMAAHNGL